MDKLSLIGKVQLAPFYTRFVFDGSGIKGINNHMHRGPYPIIHVLGQKEVLAAMDKLDGNAGRVSRRNVNLMGWMEKWNGKGGHGTSNGGPVGGGRGSPGRDGQVAEGDWE